MKRTVKLLVLVLVLPAIIVFSAIHLYSQYSSERCPVLSGSQRGKMIYQLEPVEPVIRDIRPAGNGDGAYTLVSWVNVGQTLNPVNVVSQLSNAGFTISEVNESSHVDASKYYNVFSFCTSTACPGRSIYLRVYLNGTVIAYTVFSPGDMGGIGYMQYGAQAMVPITYEALKDALNALGYGSMINYASTGVIGLPVAKYLVFIYPSNNWVRNNAGEYYGYYTISSSASTVIGGYLLVAYSNADYDLHVKLKVNGTIIAEVTAQDAVKYLMGAINNEFLQPGNTYQLSYYHSYEKYMYFTVTIIVG